MSAITDLTASLARINADALLRFTTPVSSQMATLASKLAVSSGSARRQPPTDFGLRLSHALNKFKNRDVDHVDFRSLRLLCHGCCHYIEADRYVLIGDTSAIDALLGHVAGYAHEQRRFRRLCDGLMRAYFGVDRAAAWFVDAAVHNGNEALRAFLDGTFEDIAILEPRPDWVQAVSTNRQVLSPAPGRQFAQAWLEGRTQEFQDLARRLGLSGSAWLVIETVRSALLFAIDLPDRQFTLHVAAFLTAADERRFQVLRNAIYAVLLDRYAELANPAIHPPLRDAVVSAWKNPWLALNDSAWGGVTPKARQMVTSWLKLELIHQFFEVLSEDGRQDKRRFEFWRAYHERMEDVYFALGSRAFHSRHPDTVKLKAALDGRLFELTGTEADNNAFIMCMEDTVVVEFSKHGNAAYRYNRNQLSLNIEKRSISIGELKHGEERLLHNSKQGFAWEERFARNLGKVDHQKVRSATAIPTLAPAVKAADITAFARKFGIGIDDHRSQGGSLWLSADDADRQVADQLMAWGFKYRAGKGWWRSQ